MHHSQSVTLVFLNECVQPVSSFIKALVNSCALWHRQGENTRTVIKGNFIDFLETGKDTVRLETMTKVVGTAKDDDPVVFLFRF